MFVDSDDWVSSKYVTCLYQVAYSTDSDICEYEIVKTDKEISVDASGKECSSICYKMRMHLNY